MNISELDLKTKSVVDLSIQIEAQKIEALIDSGAPQEEIRKRAAELLRFVREETGAHYA